MAKHHTFRLNDMCSVVPKRNAFGPQQGEHVIIVSRHPDLNEYIVHYKDGLYGWFKAEDLTLVLHDAHAQLEVWEDAYNDRCHRAREQDDAVDDSPKCKSCNESLGEDRIEHGLCLNCDFDVGDALDEMSEKLDRIDAGHCSECNKKLDSDEGDDESMCLSCRCDEIGGVK